jgi:hypothetical protein
LLFHIHNKISLSIFFLKKDLFHLPDHGIRVMKKSRIEPAAAAAIAPADNPLINSTV